MKSLNGDVSVLSTLSASPTSATLSPCHNAIHAGIAILLSAVKGINANHEALVDLLESIEHFVKRLDIYSKICPAPAMPEIVVKILVEPLSVLAMAAKLTKKRFGEKNAEVGLERLDRLTHEAQMIARRLSPTGCLDDDDQ
ncbi:hypothetical protein V8E52_003701 [Russula decolorans]